MVSFDVLYYKSKTKLTSAQHPARVHSCAAPRPPGREESRSRRPARSVCYRRPSASPAPLPCPPGNLPAPGWGREERHLAGMLLARKIPERFSGKVLSAAVMRGASPGKLSSPARGTARWAPAAAPGHRRCRRCPAAFVQQWRGGGGTRLLVFTADVFSLTQRLYSSWWPTAESVSRCYLHSLFYGGLKYLYSSNLYRPE